jgi:hypothetical protein
MITFDHIYKGIVVQNDDPEGMGRVKVFIPEINMTLYKDWNSDRNNDKMFTELGGNLNSGITPDILTRLKNALPWAMVKQPIMGMGTSTTYHNDYNFGEIGNGADSSAQQNIINKNPAASLPQNNQPSQLSNQLSQVAANSNTASSSQTNLNQPSTTSNNGLDYVTNSASTIPNQVTTTSTKTATTTTSTPTNGNISTLDITFTPNDRNNTTNWTNRVFTTQARLTVDGAIAVGGQSNAENQHESFNTSISRTGTTGITDTTTTSPITTNPTPIVSPFSPVITYTSPDVNPTNNPDTLITDLTFGTDVTLASAPQTTVVTDAHTVSSSIKVTFIPNDRNNLENWTNRVFTTNANFITIEGDSLKIKSNAENQHQQFSVSSIKLTDIQSINIGLTDPTQTANFTTSALGDLGTILSSYTNSQSSGVTTDPISPPSTINAAGSSGSSGSSSTPFNRSGGGGELFQLIYSTLLPFSTLLNTLVGNTNPDSKLSNNYKRAITNGTNPTKTVGSNLQTSADCKPPMRSPTQSNKVKGSVAIPAVGAHVSVYFDRGDPLYPIIDGVFYTQEDFAGIHDNNT